MLLCCGTGDLKTPGLIGFEPNWLLVVHKTHIFKSLNAEDFKSLDDHHNHGETKYASSLAGDILMIIYVHGILMIIYVRSKIPFPRGRGFPWSSP